MSDQHSTASSQSARRWRFGLRTLLVAMLLAAMGTAWFGQFLRAREAAREIGSRGGYVWDEGGPLEVVFYWEPGRGCGQSRCIAGRRGTPIMFSDKDLQRLDRLRSLGAVDFTGTSVSSPAIAQFRQTHPYCAVKP